MGSFGMAGGAAVLGDLVAGPTLSIMGFVVGAKASANRQAAEDNYVKAKKFEVEVETIKTMCKGI